jgi:quinohemoprotein ethanol dehydrogenase
MPNQGYPAPITYTVKGEQYIAITTGAGGPSLLQGGSLSFERTPGRMVVFKLNGKAKLPADPGAAPPLNPPSETWPATVVADGGKLYGRYCARCHGREASSANVVPDLRRSGALPDKAVWQAIVHDGALTANGMIGWSRALNPEQVEAVRAYVSHQARLKMQQGDPRPTRELDRATAAVADQ